MLSVADSMPSWVVHTQAGFTDNPDFRFITVLIIKTHCFSDSDGGKLVQHLGKDRQHSPMDRAQRNLRNAERSQESR
jgi:hypothetical protein